MRLLDNLIDFHPPRESANSASALAPPYFPPSDFFRPQTWETYKRGFLAGDLRCSTSSGAVCAFTNVTEYTMVSSSRYGGLRHREIKARYDGSRTEGSPRGCRRESVRLSTSRGYREIALRLAGGHVVALGEHFSGKPIRQVLQCNVTIHLRQEMVSFTWLHVFRYYTY